MLTDSGMPATPRRIKPMQALSALFRTPTRLHTPTTLSRCNKRTRAPASFLSSSAVLSTPGTSSLPPVVLQTYSVSTDSIILTALPAAPFCCHEDLLTMSRAQLEGVARTLNTRLPSRIRICPEDDFWQNGVQDSRVGCDGEDDELSRMSETEMRGRIEELVGIRPFVSKSRVSRLGLGLDTWDRVPPAPKAVRTRNATWRPFAKTPWEMEMEEAEDQADELNSTPDEVLMGSSPLAGRIKSDIHVHGRSGILSLLPILQEESEGGESKEGGSEDNEGRPFKRQRVFSDLVLRETGESRLIENMDISGSPFLAAEDEPPSHGSLEAVRTARGPVSCAKTPEEGLYLPLQRRRSARIQEISLRRASSTDTGKKIPLDTKGLKSTILRSGTFPSRHSPSSSLPTAGADAERGSNTPREIAIRLPFTSTPPHQKPESSVWSAPRILRSRSQRLLSTSRLTETSARLGRSRSERYPRPSDLTFVTIDRPKYRFSESKSNGTQVTNEDQTFQSSLSVLPTRVGGQLQEDSRISFEQSNEKPRYGRENGDPNEISRSFTMGGHRICGATLPLALCNLLSPRSRALSTSTIASTLSSTGGSPAQEGTKRTANTVSTSNGDGANERIWDALGRMAVDSHEIGSSEGC